MHSIFDAAGVAPNTYVINNEASNHLKSAFGAEKVKYQLVPPHNHQANQAELAIQTFKVYFKSILALIDP